ncbi:MAG: hypothetical protein K1X64_16515 [Myxococcaceae bacterium]|nr:hypothetical protein [Myxococcaceae bacterium]
MRTALLLVLLASPAWALTSSARLLTADDGAVLAGPEQQPPASAQALTPRAAPLHWVTQFGMGAAAAVVGVPLSLYLGQWLGSLSNNLIGAAVPTLLVIGLLPPALVTLATWFAGNWNQSGTYRWWPAFIATTLVNAGMLVAAGYLGVSVGVLARVIVYTLIQAVVLPGTATAVMRVWPLKEPAVVTSSNAFAPTTFYAPVAGWSF